MPALGTPLILNRRGKYVREVDADDDCFVNRLQAQYMLGQGTRSTAFSRLVPVHIDGDDWYPITQVRRVQVEKQEKPGMCRYYGCKESQAPGSPLFMCELHQDKADRILGRGAHAS